MTKRLPTATIQLAVAGMQLHNELKKQFEDGTVKIFGHLKLGKILILPGAVVEVPYTKPIQEAIVRGLIVCRGIQN